MNDICGNFFSSMKTPDLITVGSFTRGEGGWGWGGVSSLFLFPLHRVTITHLITARADIPSNRHYRYRAAPWGGQGDSWVIVWSDISGKGLAGG